MSSNLASTAGFSDVTVVVRECGERTADACARMLEEFGAEPVLRVEATPFSESLRRSLRLGLSRGRPWTLCIDADVLPIRAGLVRLISAVRGLPRSRLELQGLVFDKFFAAHRPAGNHLYRTSLIPKALGMIPLEGSSLRPESSMLGAMRRVGHGWVQSRIVVGVHDFEQHRADIFRKCFLQAHKHDQHTAYLNELWSALAGRDGDFRVALDALRAGLSFDGKVLVSKQFSPSQGSDPTDSLEPDKPGLLTDNLDPEQLRAALLEMLDAGQRAAARRLEREVYPLAVGVLPSELHRWLGDRAWRLGFRLVSRLKSLSQAVSQRLLSG